jgi:hypothetical protein
MGPVGWTDLIAALVIIAVIYVAVWLIRRSR